MERHSEQYYTTERARSLAILIHGFGEGPGFFTDIVRPMLEEGMSVYVPLLPGHGGSCRHFACTDGHQWIYYIRKAIMRLARDYEQIVLIGHSMGGLLAMLCADLSPRIACVVAICTPLSVRVKPAAVSINLAIGLGKQITPGHRAFAASRSLSVERGTIWEYAGWIPRLRDLFLYIRDANAAAPTLPVPLLCIHSMRDELVGPGSLRRFRRYAAKADISIVTLPDSTHFDFPPNDKDEMLGAIVNFVRRHRRDS